MEIKVKLSTVEHKDLLSYCNLNDLLISEVVKKSFTTGFNIERYGLLNAGIETKEKEVIKEIVKYVEVPVVEEKEVIKIEYVEVEKRVEVPVDRIVEVEKIVEVPVDRIIEVEKAINKDSNDQYWEDVAQELYEKENLEPTTTTTTIQTKIVLNYTKPN
jgi:hypothetical protein